MVGFMNWLELHGGTLLLGTTTILAIGSLLVYLLKAPVWKQRASELAVLMSITWLTLAVVPLPRLSYVQKVNSNYQSQPASDDVIVDASNEISVGPVTSPPTDEFASVVADISSKSKSVPNLERVSFSALIVRNWRATLTVLYVVGFVFAVVWSCFARICLSWRCRASITPSPELLEIYQALPKSRQASLKISQRTIRPMSYGVLKPKIVLPSTLCDEDEATLWYVLKHEQVHVDRLDAIGNLLITLALPILWIQPMYWYLVSQIHFSRELIADDRAAGTTKSDYVHALLNLIRAMPQRPPLVSTGIGAFGRKHPFSRRMETLIERQEPLETSITTGSAFALMLGASVMVVAFSVCLGVSQLAAQTPEPEESKHKKFKQNAKELSDFEIEDSKFQHDKADLRRLEEQVAREVSEEIREANGHAATLLIENAYVEPENKIGLYAPQDSVVASIPVRAGQYVKTGTVLIRLKNPQLEQKLQASAYEAKILKAKLGDALLEQRAGKTNATEVAVLELELKLSELNLGAYQEQLAKLTVTSPIDGYVDDLDVSRGTPVDRTTSLCTVTEFETVRVIGNVAASRIETLELLGNDASVSARVANEGAPDTTGIVAYVSPDVDLNNQRSIWVRCKNVRRGNQWLLRPGMIVDARILGPNSTDSANQAGPTNQSESKSDTTNAEEAMLLEEMIAAQVQTAKFAKLNLEHGIGTSQEYFFAEGHVSQTKARLAIAKGADATKHYHSAVAHFEKAAAAYADEFRGGRSPVTAVSNANQRLIELKLEFLRYKLRKAWTP